LIDFALDAGAQRATDTEHGREARALEIAFLLPRSRSY